MICICLFSEMLGACMYIHNHLIDIRNKKKDRINKKPREKRWRKARSMPKGTSRVLIRNKNMLKMYDVKEKQSTEAKDVALKSQR